MLEREKSEETLEEISQELNEIENEREIEVSGLSLRDRLRERVKEIFKKYGFTVTAIFLAAVATISAIITTITNTLKKLGENLGNGVKIIVTKSPPGIIGSIISFLLKAAGGVISFLAEHSRLLILAVVAFIFKKLLA